MLLERIFDDTMSVLALAKVWCLRQACFLFFFRIWFYILISNWVLHEIPSSHILNVAASGTCVVAQRPVDMDNRINSLWL